MEAKMEKIETNVVKLEVKVEAEKFDAALKKAYNKNKMHFNVQGFRKGKVPMAMVKKFYGIEVLYDDAVNFVIDETYPAALAENDIKPVDYPKVDIVEIGEGKDLIYTAEITTYPEVELGEYKGLEVKKPTYEVNDEEVEKQLASMQEKNARVTTKEEGTVEDKNIAVIDFKGYIDGTPFEGGEGTDFSLEIGSGSFIDNFEEQLIGLSVGDTKEVNVTFPENYGSEELNGKPAKFDVTVKEIKVKEVPALDDEFAKDASEFETLAELKEDIKKNLQKAEDQKAENEFEEDIITAVIENTKLDLPQVMVEKEIDHMMNDLENRLKYQGLTLEQYMEFTGNTPEKMRDFMKENAERKVKADIIIDAIAKAENIEATEEELKEKALEVAKMYSGGDHEKMADLLIKAQKPMLENEIKIVKTLDLLKANVK
ncbi:MAG: trigger factor [Clostridium sp.]|nr:trigger factor [Clostridium sp.]MCI7443975.1 trigger factor [Clostridium sp.]